MLSSRVYVPRNVRVNLAGATATLTAGQLATALGLAGTTNTVTMKLRGMRVWNTTAAASSSNYLRVRLSTSAFLLTTQLVTGQDYGTASHLPGVRFTVPDQLAKSLDGVTANSSLALATLEGYPVSGTPSQNFCLDVSLWVCEEDSTPSAL